MIDEEKTLKVFWDSFGIGSSFIFNIDTQSMHRYSFTLQVIFTTKQFIPLCDIHPVLLSYY